MNPISFAVKQLHEAKVEWDLVNTFARSKYNARFAHLTHQHGTYHAYDGFEVLSENRIKVKYVYGGGDMDFNDSFIVTV